MYNENWDDERKAEEEENITRGKKEWDCMLGCLLAFLLIVQVVFKITGYYFFIPSENWFYIVVGVAAYSLFDNRIRYTKPKK